MSALVFAVDKNNDLYIGIDGSLARARDQDAITQAAQQAAQTVLGEMIYATDAGVPYFTVAWAGTLNRRQFEAYLRRTLLAVDGVTDVPTLTTAAANNVLTYAAVIRTVYGLAAING